jgi:ribonuclease HI
MAKLKQKWYVVLKGNKPGIYTLWEDARQQVMGFPAAVYKSFESQNEAEMAWKTGAFLSSSPKASSTTSAGKRKFSKPYPSGQFLVVDAACSGVPGPTEYQGFLMPEKQKLFAIDAGWGTNNLGEFLAIVHALAYLKKLGSSLPVYSDSATAISWVRNKLIKSTLPRDKKTQAVWQLADRALLWLKENSYANPVCKWETESWGENPADFGRK